MHFMPWLPSSPPGEDITCSLLVTCGQPVTRVIEIPLRKWFRSLPFLFAIGGVSVFLAAEISRVGEALSFEKAAVGRLLLALEPNDAQFQHRLWQVQKDDSPAQAARHLRRATELSPHSRVYWDDLAAACEAMRDAQCADGAIERLLKLSPMAPNYHELAAESYLRRHRLDDSLAQFRRLLELDSSYARGAWYLLASAANPDEIFQKVLADPIAPAVQVGYVDFLSAQGDNDAAFRIWRRVAANARPFPFASVEPYLERLISLERISEALVVWRNLAELGVIQRPPPGGDSDNLSFNGDFEQFPLNGGFDWRWADVLTYLAVDFSAPDAYRGAHCLRIDFAVSQNQEYEPVYQFVPVRPNHTYRLEAYVRSEDITSDTGPCLRVTDTQQPSFRDAVSETTVGTTPWHPVRAYFSTGPKTQAVRISVWRPRGRAFPTEITGSFWLDAVSVESLDLEDGSKKQEARRGEGVKDEG
jgi:hypothetical protein